MLLRQAPYGNIAAAEAIRHLSGALANGYRPVGLLLGDGVYLAKAGQQTSDGWINLAESLCELIAKSAPAPGGEASHVAIAVHGPSLGSRNLRAADLVRGCRVVDDEEAATLVGESDALLVY